MLIEDLIQVLEAGRSPNLNKWDSNLLESFSTQIFNQLALTEKQANIALRILKRNQSYLETVLGKSIEHDLAIPRWKYPFRVISLAKIISIKEDLTYGQVIKVEFPYNESILTEFKKGRSESSNGFWSKEDKSWIFPLTEQNLMFLHDICSKFDFSTTEDVQLLFQQIDNIKKNLDNHIPILSYEENELKFVNFPENLPQIESKDPLSAVFEARKKGICVWDNNIENFLSSNEVKSITKEFLSITPGQEFNINPKKVEFVDLEQVISHMFPVAIIIPGGSELENLSKTYAELERMGIGNHEVSVMFRLSNETDKKFNEFVKTNQLNSPLTENTKVVFLSSKVPKTVVKFNSRFNLIINLGYSNVHYTLRDFVRKHENMIYYCNKTKQQEIDFADL